MLTLADKKVNNSEHMNGRKISGRFEFIQANIRMAA